MEACQSPVGEQTLPWASVSPTVGRWPHPQGCLRCGLGLQEPAPVFPGFRCPGHVLRAPPEAPARLRGGRGGRDAEKGCGHQNTMTEPFKQHIWTVHHATLSPMISFNRHNSQVK